MKRFLLTILVTIIPLLILAQDLPYHSAIFKGSNGVSMNGIRNIHQDSKGFLWFRMDEGVVRYDGYSFTTYTQNPNDDNSIIQKVRSIYCDMQSNIWVDYDGVGLSIFFQEKDEFQNYTENESQPEYIGNQDAQIVHQTTDSLVWIGTKTGLYLYNYNKNIFTKIENTDHLSILSLLEDTMGNLWIGTGDQTDNTVGQGLYLLRTTDMTLTKVKGDDFQISAFFQDSKGDIWVGTNKGIGKIFDYAPSIKPFSEVAYRLLKIPLIRSDVPYIVVSSFYEMPNGQIWFATSHGLGRLSKSHGEQYEVNFYNNDPAMSDSNGLTEYTDILLDKLGQIWVNSTNSNYGLGLYDEVNDRFINQLLTFTELDLRNSRSIDVFIDRNNLLWVGTERDGLIKFDLEKKGVQTIRHNPSKKNSLASKNVFGISEDPQGKLWIGTAFGLSHYNKSTGEIKNYTTENLDMNSDIIFSVLHDTKGHLWLGHWPHQLSKIDLKTNRNDPYRINDGFYGWTISSLLELKGDVWIGTHTRGVYKAVDGTKKLKNYRFYKNGKLNNAATESIYADSKGIIWVGTSSGLYWFNSANDSFEFFKMDDDTLPLNDGIYSIYEIDSILWLGTYSGGLVELNLRERMMHRYTESNNLSSNSVRGILSEDDQYLWLSTNNGISKFNLTNHIVKFYNEYDGLQGNEFNVNSYFKTKDGKMCFGGTNGMSIIDPKKLKDNPYLAEPTLTNFSLFYKKVQVGDTINGQVVLNSNISYTKNITLNHLNNVFTIEFSAMHLSIPSKNKYAYKLEGFDTYWTNTDAQNRKATYTSLPKGDYIFRVRASNCDGIWSEQEAVMNITILPPWWNTMAFRLLLLLFTIILFYLLYSFRIKRIQESNRKLEFMIKDKTKVLELQNTEIIEMADKLHEADQSKIKFFMNISHEFRTPLSLILGPLENMLNSTQLQFEDRENAKIMERNAHRLLRLINQLLDSTELQLDIIKLSVSKNDIVYFVRKVFHAFDHKAEVQGIQYNFYSEMASIHGWFDGDKLEKILYNLISNAFKFTPMYGEISVRLEVFENKVKLYVEDTGMGIQADKLDKIFDRFYQIEDKSQRKSGTGIGLNFAKNLALRHKGQLTVTSEYGIGSTFSLIIPIGDADYNDAEKVAESIDVNERVLNIQKLFLETKEEDTTSEKRKKPAIIIVEDSLDMTAHLKNSLKDDFDITATKNGKEALIIANQIRPDLIVSDIMMPIMDGLELCAKVKESEVLSHVPVILLTAKSSEHSVIEGYTHGADDYLTKPVDLKMLKTRAWNLIKSRQLLRKRFSSGVHLIPDDVEMEKGELVFLEKFVSIVEKNLSNSNLSYRDFIEDLGISKSLLYSKINKITGQSLNVFIRTLRLKHAALMLTDSTKNIKEVAYSTGFNDLQYFSKCFKIQFGKSPRSYRSEIIKQNDHKS